MKVIIAGGGTGGHIFPAVAIGHALQRLMPGTELLFVGAKGKMEMEKVPQEGFKIIGLDIVGFNRSNLLKNILLPFKLWKSRNEAKRIIKEFKPDAVVGVGGFASFPMLHAAQAMGVPTVIQEQNSYAGKSNKILGRNAQLICVAYQGMEQFFSKERLEITGNPVRAVIAQSQVSKQEGLNAFGLQNERPTLLVVGGSLGAKSINEAVAKHLSAIVDLGFQVLWQTGKLFIEEAKSAAQPYSGSVVALDFIRNMEHAYAAADMVVSRAGALAIAELCIVAKPVIFVPYPYAAEDHQTSNAMALVNQQAALMIKDDAVIGQLLEQLTILKNDKSTQLKMKENLSKLGIDNADERIANKIITIAGK